ncbi:MAG: hypothetical protein IIW70_07370 [Bacteroidales bacterium]|nr:hypothetical protein [Bacteroidales bacterium]
MTRAGTVCVLVSKKYIFFKTNVRTQGQGLETIVMMGEQVDLDTQMAKKKLRQKRSYKNS